MSRYWDFDSLDDTNTHPLEYGGSGEMNVPDEQQQARWVDCDTDPADELTAITEELGLYE